MLEIGSLPQEIKRILAKVFRSQKGNLQVNDYKSLERYLGNIYDQDHVSKTVDGIRGDVRHEVEFDRGCEILQVFLVSQSERKNVRKVQKKLKENEGLGRELEQARRGLESALAVNGRSGSNEKKIEFEMRNYENKLEKANQKLNLAVTTNKELRRKVDLMRKEKNVIRDIYQ